MEEKKVLVVDDEENITIAISDLFELAKFKVFKALSAEDALKIFERGKPQIAIIDVHMPFSEFDGIELLRRIKNIDKTTRCVMITRIDDKEKIDEAKKLGVEEYLIKPISLEEVKTLIEKLKK